ncbi:phage major capsid protein [Tardiphaga robiniae]|uniref:phage major capsid protein n=1 Tax=Tardiphaga robiniae TaxID=943830 RepID=UPI001586C257|nr:phage major capsid protein [Tardiphaga robiniae]
MNKQILTETFDEFSAFLLAVARQDSDGGDLRDARLVMEAVALGQNEGFGNQGGFLVPEEFIERLWARVFAAGSILARCDRLPSTKGKNITIPAIADGGIARFGGVQTYWTDEAAPAPETGLKIEQVKLTLRKLLSLIYVTDELLQDAPVLAATIERLFSLAAAFKIEREVINGTGAGLPLGVLKSPSLITVEKDVGQAAASVSTTNLSGMVSRLWGPSHQRAVWLMSNDVFGQVLALEQDGPTLIETGPNGERLLHQMPVELSEHTSVLGSTGDILLADFSQYLLAEREPNLLSSIHVRFLTDESAFKFRYRVDGAPAWAETITPENSTVTQSPFIALGART